MGRYWSVDRLFPGGPSSKRSCRLAAEAAAGSAAETHVHELHAGARNSLRQKAAFAFDAGMTSSEETTRLPLPLAISTRDRARRLAEFLMEYNGRALGVLGGTIEE